MVQSMIISCPWEAQKLLSFSMAWGLSSGTWLHESLCVSHFLGVKEPQDHRGHWGGKDQELCNQTGLFPSPSLAIFQLNDLGQFPYPL